ncbi:hypothetical protein SAMN05421755_10273 [Nitrosomonas sp. Nm33]|nr:hypothetical protein SAMN05421755_10273 [Nitrosomonas sp. Nm33]
MRHKSHINILRFMLMTTDALMAILVVVVIHQLMILNKSEFKREITKIGVFISCPYYIVVY